MLCDTAPLGLQVLSAQTVPQSSISNSSPAQTASATPVTDQSPVQPISTAAASDGDSDVSMQEVDSSTSTPKQNYMSPSSSPAGRNPTQLPPVAQNLDSQISTPPLKKGDDEPSEGYSQPNTVQRVATPATCTEAVSRFVNALQKTALKYQSLTGEEKDMVAKHIRSLPVPMTGLTDLMNVVSINTSKVVRKRKSDDPTFQPSEDDFDPPSPSPSTSRSKKLNVRDAKDSRLRESRNSNSKDVETELDIATFRKVSGRESRGPTGTGGIAEQVAHKICQKLFHFGKFVEKGTPKFARKIPEFVEQMSQPAELNLASTALGMPINNDGDRKMATKKLIQAYHEDQYNPPLFFKIWDIISLADLVEPLWENGRNSNETFVRWAERAWKKDCNPNVQEKLFPKMAPEMAQTWGRKMVAGRYWRQWCRSLSDGRSDNQNRGALLLLLAAVDDRRGVQPERDTNHEDEVNFAKEYTLKALPWVQEAATMLNPVAEQLYQHGQVDEQDLDSLKRNLRRIQGN
jgi:hypothetical protein